MRTIHKYLIPMTGADRTIILTSGPEFKPLSLQLQQGVPALWGEVEEAEEGRQSLTVSRVVMIAGTGHPLPPAFMTYAGTLQFEGGALVLHYFVDARPAK